MVTLKILQSALVKSNETDLLHYRVFCCYIIGCYIIGACFVTLVT